jgi:hypothetical protein
MRSWRLHQTIADVHRPRLATFAAAAYRRQVVRYQGRKRPALYPPSVGQKRQQTSQCVIGAGDAP